MKCPKCNAINSFMLEEEFTIIGKVAGLFCNQCNYRTGLLYDERMRFAKEIEFPPEPTRQKYELMKKEPEEGTLTVVFTGENVSIIQQLLEQSSIDGSELQDDIAAIVDIFCNKRVRIV